MLDNNQNGARGTISCANPSCGSKLRQKADDGILAWLRSGSDMSSGYFLGEKWLCSDRCLTKQVSEGILETLARPISGRLFKPMGPRIGSFLRARGWINSEQLNEALESQKRNKMKLGKCLLELGHLSEQNLLMALSEQLKVPCIFAPISNVSEMALTSLPRSVCTQFHIVPFEYRDNHVLNVAVDIDLSEEIILAIQEVLGCSVQPYLTARKAIQDLLERFVLPRPDDSVTLIDDSTPLTDHMGKIFLEEWTHYQAKSARFASFEHLIWFRFLGSGRSYDHLLILEKTLPVGNCEGLEAVQANPPPPLL